MSKLDSVRRFKPGPASSFDPQLLERLYVTEDRSVGEIAKLFGRLPNVISTALRKLGLPPKPRIGKNRKYFECSSCGFRRIPDARSNVVGGKFIKGYCGPCYQRKNGASGVVKARGLCAKCGIGVPYAGGACPYCVRHAKT